MKKLIIFSLIISLFLSLPAFTFAQDQNQSSSDNDNWDIDIPDNTQEAIGGLLGVTSIDGQSYFTFRFKPELSFGKLGLGLDVPVMYGLQGQGLRLDEYTDGIGALRMLRYVRWGRKKRDNVYFRIGELRDARLGFGMLINDYNNTISLEKRKLGFEFDVVFKKKYGLEMLYSDITPTSFNLFGVRPYYKPFGATGIPILKTFEIGASFVTDHDKTVLARTQDSSGNVLEYRNNYFLDGSGINAFSVDMGFYIFRWNWLWWDVYAQAGYMTTVHSDSLTNYLNAYGDAFQKNYLNSNGGYGYSIGSDFKFRFLGNLLRVNARAEKFWHTDYYLARFFNFAYMMDKDAEILRLTQTHEARGTYARLSASVLDKIFFDASITLDSAQIINEEHPAIVTMNLDLSQLSEKVTFKTSAAYAKVTNFDDLIHLKDNALFTTRIGYMVYELPIVKLQLHVGLDYHWTFANVYKLATNANANDWFRQTSYITPYFTISYPLGKNKKNDKKQKKQDDDGLILN